MLFHFCVSDKSESVETRSITDCKASLQPPSPTPLQSRFNFSSGGGCLPQLFPKNGWVGTSTFPENGGGFLKFSRQWGRGSVQLLFSLFHTNLWLSHEAGLLKDLKVSWLLSWDAGSTESYVIISLWVTILGSYYGSHKAQFMKTLCHCCWDKSLYSVFTTYVRNSLLTSRTNLSFRLTS